MAANGINPIKDAKVITVPPPQMVANMRVGNMDGYCVGEPWNHRAIIDGIGVNAINTQDIWKVHPEKVLCATGEFVKKYPNNARAVTAAITAADCDVCSLFLVPDNPVPGRGCEQYRALVPFL